MGGVVFHAVRGKSMKKIALLLCLCLLAALCACGASGGESASAPTKAPEATAAPAPAPTQAPAPTKAPETTPEPAPAPEATPEITEEPADDARETARTFIGKTAEELIAAIGAPESSDYAPSCLGPGEDGNLYYEGFTVYTYRENGVDTIRVVE